MDGDPELVLQAERLGGAIAGLQDRLAAANARIGELEQQAAGLAEDVAERERQIAEREARIADLRVQTAWLDRYGIDLNVLMARRDLTRLRIVLGHLRRLRGRTTSRVK